MKVRVKAIARGFDGTTIREPGDEFEIELGKDGKLGSWVKEVKAKKGGDNQAEGDDKLA